MTSLTTKLMIAAAALFAAGAASAQTMKADIPFAFQVGGKTMAPGTYYVDVRGFDAPVVIRSRVQGSVMALPASHKQAVESEAKVVFLCNRGTCSLSQIWDGTSGPGLLFHTPKLDSRESASLTVVHLRHDTE